ncbi:hypothetical protein Pla175_24490 [Pirellulimonas nuda]|uniref:DUF3150 domain-containing protein n=1 Tax=Pirellulimonas nuda TaxID=2528009 RepID=A0A518DC75_9BACT|nr:hypothetical protein [Pirellulimonas nuda]QDU89063.1 hypothetical protein Pla175_24490 [Pirellulimonas nuda]
MSVLLEAPPPTHREAPPPSPPERLRLETAAVRLSFTWFGAKKTLSADQKAQAAEAFGAAGDSLSAGKKLLDTRHPKYRGVSAVRSQAVAYWKGVSLPFPEPGVRLVRRGDVETLQHRFEGYREELNEAVQELDEVYGELRDSARRRLGELFESGDYPERLGGLFAVEWDFPSVEPPEYLRRLSPELFRRECERTRARFEEAVALAEQAFGEELQRLVSHLAERLEGQADGKPKVFRDSAVENLQAFFERFRHLRLSTSGELDELVEEAEAVLAGVRPEGLRTHTSLREQAAEGLGRVAQSLESLLVDRPRRRVMRRGA